MRPFWAKTCPKIETSSLRRSAGSVTAVGMPFRIPPRYREHVIDEMTIDEAARRIADACPPGTRVILFGSRARGEAGKHSDL